MIDDKRLYEMLKVFEEELKRDNIHTKISTQEDIDILKLARIGLWARDVGVPALKNYRKNSSFNFAGKALAALPKDITK